MDLDLLPQVLQHGCNTAVDEQDMKMLREHAANGLALAPRKAQRCLALRAAADSAKSSMSAIVAPLPTNITHFQEYCKDDLVLVAVRQEETIKALKREVKKMTKSRDHFENQCSKLRGIIVQKNAALERLESAINYRPGKRNVSSVGGFELAIRRKFGHASALVAVKMIAGDAAHGGLKDPRSVNKCEHKACVAQRIQDKAHDDDFKEASELIDPGSRFMHISAFSVRADGTSQNAVDKAKIHVSLINHVGISASAQQEALGDAVDSTATVSAGDLQHIILGSGEETYMLLRRELHSTAAPDWEDAAMESRRGTLTSFAFGLDKGPDNKTAVRLVTEKLWDSPTTVCVCSWCLLHQYRLGVASIIKTLNSWKSWPGPPLPCSYFNGLATI